MPSKLIDCLRGELAAPFEAVADATPRGALRLRRELILNLLDHGWGDQNPELLLKLFRLAREFLRPFACIEIDRVFRPVLATSRLGREPDNVVG